MSSTNNEPAFQPFCKGNRVRHKSGIVGTVEACERRVVNGSTRWVVDIDPGNGEKIVQAWPHNCELASDRHELPEPRAILGGGKADGERQIATPLTAAQRSGVDEVPIRREGSTEFVSDDDVSEIRKEHIELLRKQKIDAERALQDLVEEMKENQAEFVRALAAARKEREQAERLLVEKQSEADGWRSVVVECEKILGMNGATPNDPKISAVPFAVTRLIESKEILQKRIDEAARVLDGKPKQ